MIGGHLDAVKALLQRGAVFDLADETTDFAFFIVALSHGGPLDFGVIFPGSISRVCGG